MTDRCEAVFIPPSVISMSLQELADRLAATIHDPSGTDAEWSHHSDLSKVLRADFVRAGGAGQLVTRHPVAHVQVQPETQGAVVLVDDAARYLVESGSRFRITRHIQALPFAGLHPLQPVPWADVPHLVARAMYPESDDEELEALGYGGTHLETKQRLERAHQFGELVAQDPRTGRPLPFATGDAVVLAGDLCAFFTGSHTDKQPVPAAQPTQPVQPVEAASGYISPKRWAGHPERVLALMKVARERGQSAAAAAFDITRTRVQQVIDEYGEAAEAWRDAKGRHEPSHSQAGILLQESWHPQAKGGARGLHSKNANPHK